MNQQEAVSLVAYLNRAGLLHALDGQGPVWADALDDVAFPDAQTVARQLAKSRQGAARWVTPGDIREGVQAVRRQRVQNLQIPAPPESIDPDDVKTEQAWRRAWIAASADGHDEVTADRVACATVNVTRPALAQSPRPVAPAIETLARRMPRVPRTDRKAS